MKKYEVLLKGVSHPKTIEASEYLVCGDWVEFNIVSKKKENQEEPDKETIAMINSKEIVSILEIKDALPGYEKFKETFDKKE